MRSLGEAGQIEPETEALLMEYDVEDTPFSDQVHFSIEISISISIKKKG